jgi:hypothetical protein
MVGSKAKSNVAISPGTGELPLRGEILRVAPSENRTPQISTRGGDVPRRVETLIFGTAHLGPGDACALGSIQKVEEQLHRD